MHATASPTMPCGSEPAGSSCAQQVLLRLGGESSSLLGAEALWMLRAMASAQSVDCNCGPGLSKSRSASDEVRDASKLATRERATARSAENGLCGCRSLLAAWRRFGGIGTALLVVVALAAKHSVLLLPVAALRVAAHQCEVAWLAVRWSLPPLAQLPMLLECSYCDDIRLIFDSYSTY